MSPYHSSHPPLLSTLLLSNYPYPSSYCSVPYAFPFLCSRFSLPSCPSPLHLSPSHTQPSELISNLSISTQSIQSIKSILHSRHASTSIPHHPSLTKLSFHLHLPPVVQQKTPITQPTPSSYTSHACRREPTTQLQHSPTSSHVNQHKHHISNPKYSMPNIHHNHHPHSTITHTHTHTHTPTPKHTHHTQNTNPL